MTKALVFLYLICIFFISSFSNLYASEPKTNLNFIENKGQWNSKVLYRAGLQSGFLYAHSDGLTWQFYDAQMVNKIMGHGSHSHSDELDLNKKKKKKPDAQAKYETKISSRSNLQKGIIAAHAYTLGFVGCNSESRVVGARVSQLMRNYFVGDISKHASNVKSYEVLSYKDLWPGIDMAMFEQQGSLKYEFYLASGSAPASVVLDYQGADSIKIIPESGRLRIYHSLGFVEEKAPFAYQWKDGNKQEVDCRFVLSKNQVRFEMLEEYNLSEPLVIDPTLIFSTYSGSIADNWGNTATFDSKGNGYSAGTVFDANFPVTRGAYDMSFNSGSQNSSNVDIGILKYNSSGTALEYATFLGGDKTEVPHSIVADGQDNLVILGSSGSANYPTTSGAFQRGFRGGSSLDPFNISVTVVYPNGSDLIITRLSASGSSLLNSTFMGGTQNDGVMESNHQLVHNYGDQFRGDITIDDQGFVYVCSHTSSFDFPTRSPIQSFSGNGITQDACVFKLNPTLAGLVWSTFLGGFGDDAAYSILIDGSKNVWVGGGTTSNNLTTNATSNTIGPIYRGNTDGFLACISANGNTLLRACYLGTSAYDQIYFIGADKLGNIHAFGQTNGNYPITPSNVIGTSQRGLFVHKINNSLTQTLFSTTIGSKLNVANLSPTAFMVDDCDRIYLAGWGGPLSGTGPNYQATGTIGMPITSDAYQSQTDNRDFYIGVFNSSFTNQIYGTFFGGQNSNEHVDGGTSRFDKRGFIYQAVCAGCGGNSLFPATPGAWSTTNKSNNCNNALFKFDLSNLVASFTSNRKQVCAPATITFTNQSSGATSTRWNFTGAGGDTIVSNARQISHTFTQPGTYIVSLEVRNPSTCIQKAFDFDTIIVSTPLPIFADTTILFCAGEPIQLRNSRLPQVKYNWSPRDYVSNDTIPSPIITPMSSEPITLRLSNVGCVSSRNYLFKNREIEVKASFINDFDPCTGTFKVSFTQVSSFQADKARWYFGDGDSSDLLAPVHVYKKAGIYRAYVNVSRRGCQNNSFLILNLSGQNLNPSAGFDFKFGYENCEKPVYTFTNTSTDAFRYEWRSGNTIISREKNLVYYPLDSNLQTITLTSIAGPCRSDLQTQFAVPMLKVPNIITPNQDNKNDRFVPSGLPERTKLEVYNRWGKRVFIETNYKDQWNGAGLPAGQYYFLLTFPDSNKCKGWVSIIY